jgi:hypothetical protein
MKDDQLLEAAKAVLDHNWTGQFTKPAPSLYPHQWNWDAGFIAIGLANYNLERAMQELRSLFKGQWKNGMLPQIVFRPEKEADGQYFPGADFWQSHRSSFAPETIQTSGITMPPVHGFALWEIYQKAHDKTIVLDFLKEMFPKVMALHRYLYQHRDPNNEGLIYIRHPWEPGTDNSPAWDSTLAKIDISKLTIPPYERRDLQNKKAAVHRPTDEDYDRYVYLVDLFRKANYDDEAIFEKCPFLIQDPLFNTILVRSNECLIEIEKLLGKDISQLESWNEKTIQNMNEKLWNEKLGRYCAYDLKTEKIILSETSSGLIPLFGGIPNQSQAKYLVENISSPKFNGTKENPAWLCPTYSLETDNVNFEKYWRGPVWLNMNWMLYRGLLRYGYKNLAKKVKNDSLSLISKYGFYEYFDPRKNQVNQTGYGTDQFSWSAAVTIDFLFSDD